MKKRRERPPYYGLMAEFDNPTDVVAAARAAHEAGYRHVDAFSPYPIEELSEAVGVHHTRMPLIVLIGGIVGCLGGFLMQWYLSVINYPLNVGGKPLNSWPAFIPITFETTVLCAALAGIFGMLALNGLPEPYHPVFNAPNFALASRDRFFLLVESRDEAYDRERTAEFLRSLGPREVTDVEY
jgi:Alternative complex III, ActD subunit